MKDTRDRRLWRALHIFSAQRCAAEMLDAMSGTLEP